MNKFLILKKIVNQHAHLPKQGSEEWFKMKKNSIGGSEIGILTGHNIFSNTIDLINNKLNKGTEFKGNTATRWGKLFELITIKICKYIFDNPTIEELGSLPTRNKYLRYSPDGLTILDIFSNNKKEKKIILLEIKSPLTVIPKKIIPKYYIPQLKMGLWSIEESDNGLFINNMYRKCSFKEFTNNTKYDYNFHSKDKKKNIKKLNLLSMGIIFFYTKKIHLKKNMFFNDELKIFINDNNNNNNENILDIGELNTKSFDELLKLHDENIIYSFICDPLIFNSINNLDIFKKNILKKKQFNNQQISEYKKKQIELIKNINKNNDDIINIGIMCWKLLKSDIIMFDRDDNFINKYLDDVEYIMSTIEKIKSHENNSYLYDELIYRYK